MSQFLKNNRLIRVSNAVAAGTTTITSSTVDTQGYEEVTFVCFFGTITDGTPAIKARQGQVSNMSDGADLLGTNVPLAITDDNKGAAVAVFRPQERYVDCQIVRGGATGAVIDSVLAILSSPKKGPVTQSTADGIAAAESHVSPIEGTA